MTEEEKAARIAELQKVVGEVLPCLLLTNYEVAKRIVEAGWVKPKAGEYPELDGYRKVITCQRCEYSSPSTEGTGKFKCDKPPMSMVLHRGNWFCDDAIERKPRKRKVTRKDARQAQEHEVRATYLHRMAGADE